MQTIVHCYTNIDTVDTFKPSTVVQQPQSQLLMLSDDILINVLQYLQIVELIQLRTVSVQLRALVFHSEVWKHCEVQYDHNMRAIQHLCWYLRLNNTNTLYSAECVAEYMKHIALIGTALCTHT